MTMPPPHLVQHGLDFLQPGPGVGQDKIHGAQEYVGRALTITEQPAHYVVGGNAKRLTKLHFISSDEARLYQYFLVSVLRAHGSHIRHGSCQMNKRENPYAPFGGMIMRIPGLLGACALLLAGCASVQPSAEELSKLPVVQFGEPVPAGSEYILFFPADKPIPTNVSIKGNIFAREAEQRLDVTLRRGIYAYKNWISYDRISWQDGRQALKSDVQVVLPSYAYPKPGVVKIQMDEQR